MGFNNGYDSGYSDCEAENRKRWEREAVERYKAENHPSSGGSTSNALMLDLGATGLPVYQVCAPGGTPVVDPAKATIVSSEDVPVGNDACLIIQPLPDQTALYVNGADGDVTEAGVYYFSMETGACKISSNVDAVKVS